MHIHEGRERERMRIHTCRCLQRQEALDFLELELQVVVSCLVRLMRIQFKLSTRSVHTLND